MRILLSVLLLLTLTHSAWAQRWSPDSLDKLRTLEVKSAVSLESAVDDWDGSNPYLLLTLSDGTRGVFRSEDEPWGSAAEVAGYKLDQLLGTELVPPTVHRTLKRDELGSAWHWQNEVRPGSLQLFVEGAERVEDRFKVDRTDLANSEILGFVMGRYDNHSGNLLTDADGRVFMIDFEGSLDFQMVRYGDFPFTRRGGWAQSPLGISGDEPFPFTDPSELVDPDLETIQKTFGPWWGQYWPQGMVGLHGLLRGIPERTIPYVIWNNRLWVQVKVRSRHPVFTEFYPKETMTALADVTVADLQKIFEAPYQAAHLEAMVGRQKQILESSEYLAQERPSQRILMVLTSHDKLGDTNRDTGFYLSEVTHPLEVFTRAGYEVDFVSPKGGNAPVDGADKPDEVNERYLRDERFLHNITNTLRPDQVDISKYDAIFFAGGHGTMWDFPDHRRLQGFTRSVYESGGVVGAVCHGPAALVNVKLSNGKYLVEGQPLSAFTNEEEEAAGLTKVMPFLLETRLRSRGAVIHKSGNFQKQVSSAKRLVTGQNPASAHGVAEEIVKQLRSR